MGDVVPNILQKAYYSSFTHISEFTTPSMMTSSNGNSFRVTALCAENSSVPGEFPAQRPVTRSFDVFFDLRLNKGLSKQSWGRWFETLSCSLWRHSNGKFILGARQVQRKISQSTLYVIYVDDENKCCITLSLPSIKKQVLPKCSGNNLL